jgi:hypothetical protein
MYRFLNFFMLTMLLYSCNNAPKCIDCTKNKAIQPINVVQIVDSISIEYSNNPEIEFSFTLYQRKQFITLLKHVCQYKTELLYIVLNDSSNIKKEVALYALQHLCIEEYLEILNVLYKNYLKKNISYELFDKSITTTLSDEVCKNYDNPRLQELFNQILLDSSFTEGDKKYIRNLKSGKVWDGISWDYYFNDRKVPWLE